MPVVMKSKHPVHIMGFIVVTNDGDIMPPFFFLHGLTFNMVCMKCLEEVMPDLIESEDAGRPYV